MGENKEQQNQNLPASTEQPKEERSLGDAWREVGEQFQSLGEKLAGALRSSWSEEENKEEQEETMRKLRDDLRASADRVDRTLKHVREETAEERASTLRATREAGGRSVEEARVITASTLRKLNEQLDQLAQRIDLKEDDTSSESETSDEKSSTS